MPCELQSGPIFYITPVCGALPPHRVCSVVLSRGACPGLLATRLFGSPARACFYLPGCSALPGRLPDAMLLSPFVCRVVCRRGACPGFPINQLIGYPGWFSFVAAWLFGSAGQAIRLHGCAASGVGPVGALGFSPRCAWEFEWSPVTFFRHAAYRFTCMTRAQSP